MANLDKPTQAYLNSRLSAVLDELTVVHGWPDLEQYLAINSLSEALAKHEPWRSHLGFFDLFECLGTLIRRAGVESDEKKLKLTDAFTPDRFAQFTRETREFLLSLPRPYDAWVDLPAMPAWGSGEIALTSTMSLVEADIAGREKVAAAMGGLEALLAKPFTAVRLRIRVSGYGAPRLDTTAMADAISQIKQFFQLFRRMEIYVQATTALGGLLTGRREAGCEVVDPKFPNDRMTVQLPERVARFLSSMSVDNTKLQTYDYSAAKTLVGGEMREARTREERAAVFKEKIRWITELMDCPPDWPDAPRIRTALEWAFDSAENDNQTLSFLQASIGLEALLGDDDQKEEPLTVRLADRCAYLLGQTQRDREGIREQFKEMYKVRSKLVHGRSPRLNLHDYRQLSFAQSTLGEVITEEANRLLRALRKAQPKAT